MKKALQISLLVLVSVGFATAAFAGVAGIIPSLTSASSDVFILIYTVIGSMLVSLIDYSSYRPIRLHVTAKTRQVVPFADRRGLHHGHRIAA